MEPLVLTLGWLGIYAPLALGAIGSIIGCGRAGQAAAGALLQVDGGYGRFIGVSALPSSQVIYGIVVTFSLVQPVTVTSSPGLFGIGALAGVALLFSAVYQGFACASAIDVGKDKPDVFGVSIAPAAIVEGFAVFAFVFALILAGDIPD
ncbi:MAG: ATP synthase subunit C [Myxococcota bacterium]